MYRSERGREAGFTLIEIILVSMLIGIVSAVAIARFPEIPKTGAVARNLTSDIRYAKELANRLQTMCGIFFINNTSYRVFRDNNTATATIDPVSGADFVVNLSGQLSGVTLTHNFAGNTLKFNSLGTPLDGNDAAVATPDNTITVAGTGGNRIVTVEPNTGKVTGP